MKIIKIQSGSISTVYSESKVAVTFFGLIFFALAAIISPPWSSEQYQTTKEILGITLPWATVAMFSWVLLFTRVKITLNNDKDFLEYRLSSLYPVAVRKVPVSEIQAFCVQKIPYKKTITFGLYVHFKNNQSLHLLSGIRIYTG